MNHESSTINLVDDVEVSTPMGPPSKCQRALQLVEVDHPPLAMSRVLSISISRENQMKREKVDLLF